MTNSTATTEFDVREALRQHFHNNAIAALDQVIVLLQQRDFYEHVLKKLEQRVDLSDDLPELKTVKPAVAKKVIQRLFAGADKAVASTWELSSNVSKLFDTTIKKRCDDMSLLPCFDVEYKAETAKGVVKIAIKTWRRNVTLTVAGNAAALDLLYAQYVLAGMQLG